jgi:hypothetical protein
MVLQKVAEKINPVSEPVPKAMPELVCDEAKPAVSRVVTNDEKKAVLALPVSDKSTAKLRNSSN